MAPKLVNLSDPRNITSKKWKVIPVLSNKFIAIAHKKIDIIDRFLNEVQIMIEAIPDTYGFLTFKAPHLWFDIIQFSICLF